MDKIDIKSLSLEQLTELMLSLMQPKFRAGQIFDWIHKKHIISFEEMNNLPPTLRSTLQGKCTLTNLKNIFTQTSKDGTVKILFELQDTNTIDSVVMSHSYGISLCISSQVGCRMGCAFCASTKGGKIRDLTAGEMLDQVYKAAQIAHKRIDSIVIMGIGEPLDNFDNLLRFLELINHPKGLGMSHRHISVSTCGLCTQIDRLAEHKLQVTLSVSLHAVEDQTRTKMMPINKSFDIATLMESCKNYFMLTGRRISYEFALISGINDDIDTASKLIQLLKGQNCHVNLIPINPVTGTGFTRPSRQSNEKFRQILENGGLSATIRRELGADIDAACGQLRRNHKEAGSFEDNRADR